MNENMAAFPNWIIRGKTIRELIVDLQSFEDRDLKVEISTDSGLTHKAISMVIKRNGRCLLVNYELDIENNKEYSSCWFAKSTSVQSLGTKSEWTSAPDGSCLGLRGPNAE